MEVLNQILTKLEHLERSLQLQNSVWFTVLEAASYGRISESKIRKLIAKGELPINRIGGKILISRKTLDYYIMFKTGKPNKRQREAVECLI